MEVNLQTGVPSATELGKVCNPPGSEPFPDPCSRVLHDSCVALPFARARLWPCTRAPPPYPPTPLPPYPPPRVFCAFVRVVPLRVCASLCLRLSEMIS